MWASLALLVSFMAGEVAGAILTGSLALLADAGHMLTDAGAIGAGIWAVSLAKRPPERRFSYGLPRAEIVAAALNGVALLVAAGLIAESAIRRLAHPPKVAGLGVVVVACVGMVVSLVAVRMLHGADRRSLNVEGVFRHVLTDLVAFAGTATAGMVVYATGFRRADPLASLAVMGIMVFTASRLLRMSGRILLEGTPETVELLQVRRHIEEMEDVVAVHDLHAWTLTSGLPVLSAHVVVRDECFSDGRAGELLDRLQACLHGHFDVEHSTFQLEPVSHQDHEPGVHE